MRTVRISLIAAAIVALPLGLGSPALGQSEEPLDPGVPPVIYDGRVDVGGGRSLEVRCVGSGSPTILLEGGGTTPSLNAFGRMFVDSLAAATTTCHYSRAGGGSSSPLADKPTVAAYMADAYVLLDGLRSAGVQGPYVFAGWSFGGTIALAEALEHPDRTAGLVILDTDFTTDFLENCRASGHTAADCQAEYDGDIDAKSLETELLPRIHPLPGIPIRIISAMVLADCDDTAGSVEADIEGTILTASSCTELAEAIAAKQLVEWGRLGPQVTQTLVDATHDGLIDQAGDAVAQVILDTVADARGTMPQTSPAA